MTSEASFGLLRLSCALPLFILSFGRLFDKATKFLAAAIAKGEETKINEAEGACAIHSCSVIAVDNILHAKDTV